MQPHYFWWFLTFLTSPDHWHQALVALVALLVLPQQLPGFEVLANNLGGRGRTKNGEMSKDVSAYPSIYNCINRCKDISLYIYIHIIRFYLFIRMYIYIDINLSSSVSISISFLYLYLYIYISIIYIYPSYIYIHTSYIYTYIYRRTFIFLIARLSIFCIVIFPFSCFFIAHFFDIIL